MNAPTSEQIENAAVALVAHAVLAFHNEAGADEVTVEASSDLVALAIADSMLNGGIGQAVKDAFLSAVRDRNLMAALCWGREIVEAMNTARRSGIGAMNLPPRRSDDS